MVICLTTPAAHYPIIKQALLAGKHVFSEKMIAVDLWQGKELVQIANEKGLHLGVAPDTFLGASVQTAKYIVDKGLIGKPLSCRASISRDYGIYAEFLTHLAKKGAGIGFDMGGYYLTALAAILGPRQHPHRRAGLRPGIRCAGAERHLGDDAVRKRRSGHTAHELRLHRGRGDLPEDLRHGGHPHHGRPEPVRRAGVPAEAAV